MQKILIGTVLGLTILILAGCGKTVSGTGGGGSGGNGGGVVGYVAEAGLYQGDVVAANFIDPNDYGYTKGSNDIIQKVFAYINSNSNVYTLVLDNDVPLEIASEQILNTGAGSLTLIGKDTERIIKLSNTGYYLFQTNSELILDKNITLKGIGNNNRSLVRVQASGKLVMKNGSKITGNKIAPTAGTTLPGGVAVYGNFTMEGGIISDNEALYGGGVGILSSGKFEMNGGTISGNTALNDGGGIYSDTISEVRVTMSGSASIIGNTASGKGGGVYFSDRVIFNMTGGTISGNKANSGGGVAIRCFSRIPEFTMSGSASIADNTAIEGGGVHISDGSSSDSPKFTMSGSASIAGNTADNCGGGIALMNTGTNITETTMSESASIINNQASYGGGVYVADGSEFNMTGGEIASNTVSGNGAGVYVVSAFSSHKAIFEMSAGIIHNNTAASHGGGIYIDNNGTASMNGEVIAGNTAGKLGGGVYCLSSSSALFTKTGGIIYGSDGGINSNNAYGDGHGYGHAVYRGINVINSTLWEGNNYP